MRPRAPVTAGVGTKPDASLVAERARDIRAAAHAALDEVAHLSEVPRELEAVIGHGRTWDDALEAVERDDGDVLVVGSGPPPGRSRARRRRRSSGTRRCRSPSCRAAWRPS